MTATVDNAVADLQRANAELQRQLAERTAERDEALQRETATAEVLGVINASPGDLAPVFDAMLEKALNLCQAAFGALWSYDGGNLHVSAVRGAPSEYEQFLRKGPHQPTHMQQRLLRGRPFEQIADVTLSEAYRAGDPLGRAGADLGGVRTLLAVPLRKDDKVLGIFGIYRQEVRPFSDKQIALLQNFAAQAVIAMENARLITETREALDQQTATAEVLRVINSSPGDLAPVFDAILEKAHALCGAAKGALVTCDGERFRAVATRGLSEAYAALLRAPDNPPGSPPQRLLDGESLVQVPDMGALAFPIPRAAAELEGIRTVLYVPLRKDGALLGFITAYRQEVRPFSDKQIALLQNFAVQAVIAMENARLITETREALEQQTATAEVLGVINSSPGDLTPVFDALLDKATTLCDAAFGVFFTYDGERLRATALRGTTPAYTEFLTHTPHRPGPNDIHTRLIAGEDAIQFPDVIESPGYRSGDPLPRAFVDLGGGRTVLAVALRKDGVFLGEFAVYRREVRPFSDKQIALLQNFAAQAVIAMENARLITETREALEQQTATAEVLSVINSSPGDLAPVFSAILEKAHSLCGVAHGGLVLRDGEIFRAVATQSYSGPFAEQLRQGFRGADNPIMRLLLDGEGFVHIPDLAQIDHPMVQASVKQGVRTGLYVPLRKDGALLGMISSCRREIHPFSDKEIALLQNFAVQAVIAMENARLITETREALEQQTATAEVLQVINSSPGDLAPVFDAMLERAVQLCEAQTGHLMRFENGEFNRAASFGGLEDFDTIMPRHQPLVGIVTRDSVPFRTLTTRAAIHALDMVEDESYRAGAPAEVAGVEAGIRTALFVPLLREGEVIGNFVMHRWERRPFSDKQIALVENFAAQAVIAIENARLITETREALEQQTATAEVLQVINSSPGDLGPVFDAMLNKATKLCDAAFGILWRFDGEFVSAAALHQVPAAFAEFWREPRRPGPDTGPGRVMRGEGVLAIPDLSEYPPYIDGEPLVRTIVDLAGARSVVVVPLRTEGAILGAITIYRQEVRPFSDKQIALLQNFAAQAVIAMENARLITETREALEQQTATATVLGIINSSPSDLAPVFDAMLEKAVRLCESAFGILRTWDGERLHFAAAYGDSRFTEWSREHGPFIPENPASPYGRIVRGESVVTMTDAPREASYPTSPGFRAMAEASGMRSGINVALRKDGALLGIVTVYRQKVRPFSDKQIALLQNFAAQAVIAMENARLISETREALEQQTATAEVLGVINSSPGDLAPVFETILEKAHTLCGATHGALGIYDGDYYFRSVAARGYPEPLAARLREGFDGLTNPVTRPLIDGARFVHIPDLAEIDHPIPQAVAKLGGFHTGLFLPLRKDSRLLGHISVTRSEVRPFADKDIALLQNFAAQAVIAMENARLITETREALEQQTATAEVLGVINASPGDLAPVFDSILEKAHNLCGAVMGGLLAYDGENFRAVATHNLPPALAENLRQGFRASENPLTRPLLDGARFLQIPDIVEIDHPIPRAGAALGIRTLLSVSLRKDNVLLGTIVAVRDEVRPFSDKQIALLESFAAQAVIAMENARLITETREALEQQQAIAEILQVINRSPGELQPVFDILLDKAMQLCGAAFGILAVIDGEQTQTVAARGLPPALAKWRRNNPVINPQNTLLTRVLAGESYVHTVDLKDDDLYRGGEPLRRANVDLGGARTSLYVPLMRDQDVLGTIHIYRQEVRPFTDKQVALLQNFAAQAVIAMENARLLDQIRQRQAELRVTFDNMADGVAMFDEELRLAAWNRNFQQMIDLPDELLAERPSYADYLRILAERGEFGTDNLEAEVNRRLEHIDRELRVERTRPDGRVIEVRRNAVPDGGYVLIYSDITERKRSEAEIRTARDAAEATLRDLRATQSSLIQAQKMAALGQLTAGIAHEIKNPLNFVNNFAGLSVELLDELKETTAPAIAALDDAKRAEADENFEMLTSNLEKISEHGRRADNIVKSMLEHSRGVSGERREVDLNNLIDEALNLAYHGARAQDGNFNIGLEHDYAPMLKPIELVPQEITRVFLNLFGNGFYAAHKRAQQTADGPFQPLLTVATRDLGEAVEVRIRDNGIGIATEIKDKLFQPFFTTKPTGEGTGLGLSISYDIVTQQHGGTITVDSRVGEFTEFTIRLPRQ